MLNKFLITATVVMKNRKDKATFTGTLSSKFSYKFGWWTTDDSKHIAVFDSREDAIEFWKQNKSNILNDGIHSIVQGSVQLVHVCPVSDYNLY